MKAFAFAVLLLLPLPLAAADTLSGDPDVLYQEGLALHRRGDEAGAMNLLSEALLRRPSDPRIQAALNAVAEKLAAMDDELRTLDTADLEKMILRAQQIIQRRKEALEEALKRLKIADESSRQKDPASTLKACRGVDILLEVSLGDDDESREIKKYLHSLCGNLEGSVQEGALPDPVDALKVSGYIAFCRSDWRAAAEAWRQAAALRPEDEKLKFLLQRAEENHARALEFMRSVQLQADAEEKLRRGKPGDAIPLLEEVLRLSPGNGKALALLERCQQAVRQETRQAVVAEHRRLALEHERAGRWLDAGREWLTLLETDPLNEEARAHLDRVKRNLVRSMDVAADVPAGDAAASAKRYTLGLVEYAEGRLKEARDQFGASLRLDPSNAFARRALQRVEEEIGARP